MSSTKILKLPKIKTGAWLPVASLSELSGNKDMKTPVRVEIAGEKYAVWNTLEGSNGYKWSVVSDVCPHRNAPLSQGRIDPVTKCIECPYHGWQFDHDGECTKIPQLDDKFDSKIPPNTDVKSLHTYITGDMLWAFVPLVDGQYSNYDTLPDEIIRILPNVTFYTSRELPYSFDFLIENFMDPAHIPFAHHSLQGVRSDGSPISSQLITSLDNNQTLSVKFQDVIRGKKRNGVVTFNSPCYFTLHNNDKLALVILCVPVAPGRSRIFVAPLPGRKIPKFIPKWFMHSFTNSFLDTDIWIHDQERFIRNSKNSFLGIRSSNAGESSGIDRGYILATDSDLGCKSWRLWWNKHMKDSSVFGPANANQLQWLPISEQINRYESHTKYCVSCKTTLNNINLVKKYSIFLIILPLVFNRNIFTRIAGLISYTLTNVIGDKIKKSILGPERGDAISAAQFPEK